MRVASRFLLPVEMFLAIKLCVLALIGGVGGGTLNRALAASGEHLAWLIIIGSIGLPMLCVSAYEWFYLRHADESTILRSVSARAFFSFLGVATWLSTLIYIVTQGLTGQVMYAVILAIPAAGFHAWSFSENLKVKVALDEAYETPSLRFYR